MGRSASIVTALLVLLKLLVGLVLLILILLRDLWRILCRKLGRKPSPCGPLEPTSTEKNWTPPTTRLEETKPTELPEESRAIKREKAYDVAEIQQKYPRAYEKWTEEEDNQLRRLVDVGHTVREMASILQRKPGAIRSRMMKLSLI